MTTILSIEMCMVGFDAKIACPDCRHLPTDDEWKVLEIYLGVSWIRMRIDNTDERGTNEGGKIKKHKWLDF